MSDSISSQGSIFFTKIFDVVLTANTSTGIDTGPLPQGYSDLMVMWSVKGDAVGTVASLTWRFNNSGSALYSGYQQFIDGTATANNDNASFGRLGTYPIASASNANEYGTGTAWIPCYSFTDRWKSWHAHGGMMWGASNSTQAVLAEGTWASTAAITSIQLLPASNNLLTGSRLVVFAI